MDLYLEYIKKKLSKLNQNRQILKMDHKIHTNASVLKVEKHPWKDG